MIINRIYETQNLLSLFSFLIELRTYQRPCENISFDASLVIYMNGTIIAPTMIINTIHATQNLVSL
jgi:hypothetical protein